MTAKKKTPSIEYRMFIAPEYDETRKKETTLFLMETIKEFSTFSYSIVVKPAVESKTIRLDILGLKTPEVTMPAFGPATKRLEIDDLHGTYTLIIAKLDGAENTFTMKRSKKGITIDDPPPGMFIEIFTESKKWKAAHTPQKAETR